MCDNIFNKKYIIWKDSQLHGGTKIFKKLSGNPGMRVGVYYNDDLSFIPKKIFIRYEMNGETWQKDENKVQKIDLRAIDGYCESDGIILPRLNKAAETVVIYSLLLRLLL